MINEETEIVCADCGHDHLTIEKNRVGDYYYKCPKCGSTFDYPNFEKIAEICNFDIVAIKQHVNKIAEKLPKTTGIIYGTGKLWYRFKNWLRTTEVESGRTSDIHNQ